MCANTYFDTICVHLVEIAYSLPQMRTIKLTDKLEFSELIIFYRFWLLSYMRLFR